MFMNAKLKRADFASVADLVSWIESTPPTYGSGSSSTDVRKYAWDMLLGLEGAIEYGKGKPWREGADAMIKGTASASQLRKAGVAPVIGYDVAGFAPDVPAYLAGVPDHMMAVTAMAEMQASKPIVSVCLTGFSCTCTSTAMVNRGVAFMSLVDALESDGYRCEVFFACAPSKTDSTEVRVCVKRAQDHWTPASAAFALAHPGFFRRLWFAAAERFADNDQYTQGGYGTSNIRESSEYTFAVGYQLHDASYGTLAGALTYVQKLARKAGFDVDLIADKKKG